MAPTNPENQSGILCITMITRDFLQRDLVMNSYVLRMAKFDVKLYSLGATDVRPHKSDIVIFTRFTVVISVAILLLFFQFITKWS